MKQLNFHKRYTNRSSIAVEKYFNDISKVEPLGIDEEVKLVKRYKMGDTEALNQLVNSNLRFVVSVAKQYEGLGLSLEDLISEGNIGLMKAARRFDETKGFKFISYAVFWIRQNILKALNEHARVIRLPYNQIATIQKLQQTFTEMEQQFGFEPSDDMVGEALGMSGDTVREALRHQGSTNSLDKPVGEESDTTLGDMLEDMDGEKPDNEVVQEAVQIELGRYLNALTDRQQQVIIRHFGLNGRTPMEINQIADELGLGRERIRQIKVQALRKLRKLCKGKGLQAYLS